MPGMTTITRRISLLLCLLEVIFLTAHTQVTALPHAYAHNDYWHKRPLYDALGDGFTHIEADVYLRHGKLLVSHKPPLLGKHSTLEEMYLEPLVRLFTQNRSSASSMDTIVLMIDIKSNAAKTYQALRNVLADYKPFLSSCDHGRVVMRNLTIVLTGHRPLQILGEESSRFVFADENLDKINRETFPDAMYITASCRYSNVVKWNGKGTMGNADKIYLTGLVNKAHAEGKKVRLWASPENEQVWLQLLHCGVDLINTDHLAALKQFFTSDVSSL